ncbi:MAG TPA: alpha/beta fold hydrolase [Chitinophagaceae bacterium]|nr:alpha/beta fold hydrolase [Chitinophagaceae bacterium]
MKKLSIVLLMTLLLLFSMAGCSASNDPVEHRATFVLVHGAWQAPYVWTGVKEALEKQGQKVVLVELPAHGNDQTPPASVSMAVYSQKVMDVIAGLKGKVVLVGHSMGGVVITAVAEKMPEKIDKLVYVGAFVPASGQSLSDLAMTDAEALLGKSIIVSKDQLTLDIVKADLINIFCQDAPPAVQQLVQEKFRVEPAIPFGDKIILSSKFQAVDKYYIHTTMDHAIGMKLQQRMVAAAGITKVFSIATGHSPFLSKPAELAKLLLNITQ